MKRVSHDYELSFDDLEIEIFAGMTVEDYNPGYEAPACNNPSSPLFSDPGCGSEYNDIKFHIVVNGTYIELPAETNSKIYDALEIVFDSKLDDAIYKKYLK